MSEPGYNILLVDDEPLVRTGLRVILEKLKDEFKINSIVEAQDGQAAISTIEKNLIDIVFTDIKMPNIDGLGLLSWISTNKPQCRSVVLSCHDDYDFVRNSFRQNIIDYILKYDIDIETIRALLSKIASNRNRIDEQSHRVYANSNLSKMRKEYHAVSSICKKHKYNMTAVVISDAVSSIFNKFCSHFSELLNADIHSVSEKAVEYHPVQISRSELLITAGFSSAEKNKDIERLFNRIIEIFSYRYKIDLSVSILYQKNFSTASELEKISELMLGFCYLKGPGVYNASGLTGRENFPDPEKFLLKYKIELNRIIREENIPFIKRHIDEFPDQVLSRTLLSRTEIKEGYCEFYNLVRIHFSEILGREDNRQTERITESSFLRQAVEVIEELFFELSRLAFSLPEGTTVSMGINRALIYIHSNFTKKGFSLSDVAEYLHYSASYLSRQFKKETGSNIVNYINKLRMLEARRFIKMKKYMIYEISEMVGFNNYNYFSKIYKNYFGINPASDIHNFDLEKKSQES